eukprot:m51a1_g1716 hypothetical protein (783) ;mRNA; f:46069-49053
MAASSYKLARELRGHTADARSLCYLSKLNLLWSADGKDLVRRIEGAHAKAVAALCEMADGSLASGGYDALVKVWPAASLVPPRGTGDDDAAPAVLAGHEGPVTSLSCAPDGTLVSGSWDNTARVWRGGECERVLRGHTDQVWAVHALPDSAHFVTAGDDQTVRTWRRSDGAQLSALPRVHTARVRGIASVPSASAAGALLATCSNDGTVALWDGAAGACVAQLRGHTSFVYALCAGAAAGELASCGEDRTARVWREGALAQTLVHPACVWACACVGASGDLATACADGCVRLWTRDAARWAAADVREAYEASLASDIASGAVGVDVSAVLSGAEVLRAPGSHDGEIRVARDEGGRPCAYHWSAEAGEWRVIGEVVDGRPHEKAVVAGKEYSEAFDVELDGRWMRLGYNAGENPYVAARRFIEDNDLDADYLEEVAQFVIANTSGAAAPAAADDQFCDPLTGSSRYIPGTGAKMGGGAGVDPFTGANRYIPGEGQQQQQAAQQPAPAPAPQQQARRQYDYFPQTEPRVLLATNVEGLRAALQSTNDALLASDDTAERALGVPAPELAAALAELPGVPAVACGALVAMTRWRPESLLAVVDLLSLAVADARTAALWGASEFGAERAGVVEYVRRVVHEREVPPAVVTPAAKFLCNALAAPAFEAVARAKASAVLDLCAENAKCELAFVRSAVSSVLFNFVLRFRDHSQDTLIQCLSLFNEILSSETSPDIVGNTLMAVGTALWESPSVAALAAEFGLRDLVRLQCSSEVQPVRECAAEVLSLME